VGAVYHVDDFSSYVGFSSKSLLVLCGGDGVVRVVILEAEFAWCRVPPPKRMLPWKPQAGSRLAAPEVFLPSLGMIKNTNTKFNQIFFEVFDYLTVHN
jgi:hypothetical protein